MNKKELRLKRLKNLVYYHYKQAEKLWKRINRIMEQDRSDPKVKGLLLTGVPHGGKSTVIRQYIKHYLENVEGSAEEDIIYFICPTRLKLKGVMASLCEELGIIDIQERYDRYSTHYFIKKAALKLEQDHRLLIIDEFQNLFELGVDSRKEILSGFNSLINHSRVPIILVGVDGVDLILKTIHDDKSNLKGTFGSRFPEFKLKTWKDDTMYREMLMAIHEDCYLEPGDESKPFYIYDGIREAIIEWTDGILGKIIYLIKCTAWTIIEEGLPERITYELLQEAAQDEFGVKIQRNPSSQETV
ncbi:MAG: TniB family NTP-binding protein [Candidatus Hodarchaeales archaeon]|jgi:hypothetical protein